MIINTIKKLALLIFIIPIMNAVISYLLSVKFSYVEFCIPNIDGCTSISRAGRYPPVSYFFKTFMCLTGVMILLYWKNIYNFLSNGKSNFILKIGFFLGIMSVIFLFLYIYFLGESNYYAFFRRIGIFIFIFFTVLAELFLSIYLFKYGNNYKNLNNYLVKVKFFFNIFLIILGLIFFPIVITKIFTYPNLKNIISWNYFLLIQFSFLSTYFVLKKN